MATSANYKLINNKSNNSKQILNVLIRIKNELNINSRLPDTTTHLSATINKYKKKQI